VISGQAGHSLPKIHRQIQEDLLRPGVAGVGGTPGLK
jgi:hypothetical protein